MSVARVSRAPNHLAVPDALRTFAIVAVVATHLFDFSKPAIRGHGLELEALGEWSVNAFFLLSGFLLGNGYVRAILDDRPLPDIRKFYARRFLRIYPTYAAAVLLSVVLVAAFVRPVSPTIALLHALMLQNFSQSAIEVVNPPFWTMSIDAAFYLILPPAMAVLARSSHRMDARKKTTMLALALGATIVICIAYRLVETILHPDAIAYFAPQTVFVRTIFGMFSAFALGIGTALLIAVVPRERFHRNVYLGIVIAGLVLPLAFFAEFHVRSGTIAGVREYVRLALLDTSSALSVALILYGVMQGGLPIVPRLAQLRIVSQMALLAYAVYLIHYPILEIFALRVFVSTSGFVKLAELTVTAVLVILPLAIGLHYVVERPFLAMKDRMRSAA